MQKEIKVCDEDKYICSRCKKTQHTTLYVVSVSENTDSDEDLHKLWKNAIKNTKDAYNLSLCDNCFHDSQEMLKWYE